MLNKLKNTSSDGSPDQTVGAIPCGCPANIAVFDNFIRIIVCYRVETRFIASAVYECQTR